MESEILSVDELVTLTGHKQPKAQMQWLDNNGINYLINGKSKPVVGRFHVREVLMGTDDPKATSELSSKAHSFSFRGLNK
ncbi:DUF4224 domain-containing protein [Vibrio phage Marilyn]|jgi:hypothetical protein|nr:DUF4224 domain-containing protein [Vibrio phage Marilyn]WCD55552.1 DUF4224 domain-containing protein [Vibrio phage Fayden]WCD55609.1 DUF4224 domain-containing protein [Vibrio phage Baybae]WCD55668.1 DUF4224 domain-containing protein [Vibrio phage Vaitephage]